jgi:hypothetical protein
VGNGNRTRNRRSHSPVLCQLSYSHRHADYTTALDDVRKRFPDNLTSGSEKGRQVKARHGSAGSEMRSLLRYEAAPHRTQRMSNHRKGKTKQGDRETIENSRKKKTKPRIQLQALASCRRIRSVCNRPHPRPTPTYSNPIARSRTESSRFFVSTMIGFFSRCLMRSKSSARNSGQPVPTTSASMPSAAA